MPLPAPSPTLHSSLPWPLNTHHVQFWIQPLCQPSWLLSWQEHDLWSLCDIHEPVHGGPHWHNDGSGFLWETNCRQAINVEGYFSFFYLWACQWHLVGQIYLTTFGLIQQGSYYYIWYIVIFQDGPTAMLEIHNFQKLSPFLEAFGRIANFFRCRH